MPRRTTGATEQRKQARRQAFLDAAVALFGRHGYHATTVPMIVEQAGSSIGNFYFYFRNKEDVCAAALEEFGRRIADVMNVAIGEDGATHPFEQMRAAMTRVFTFLAKNPDDARILIVETSSMGERLTRIRTDVLASHTRSVEQKLRALSAQLPPLDPRVVADCWVGAVFQALCRWLETSPAERPAAESVAAEVARFNLRGIGAPP